MAGFDRTLFVDQNEEFKCGICHDVQNNPHQCLSGHSFCYDCIKKSVEIYRNCPSCKKSLKVECLGACLYLKNQIKALQVRCYVSGEDEFHCENSCEWLGTLEERQTHISVCRHWKSVDCPLYKLNECMEGCEKKIPLKDLAKHLVIANLSNSKIITQLRKEADEPLNGKNVIVKLPDGSSYIGAMENGKKHGFGILESADNSIRYSGSWENDSRHGHGSFRNRNLTYDGEWQRGSMTGHCFLHKFCIGRYTGSCLSGQYSGYGIMEFNDGSHYIGAWSGGFKNGPGIWKTPHSQDCVLYDGEFVDGRQHGKGKSTFANGAIYEGNYVLGEMCGLGSIRFISGETYNGNFQSDLYNGEGEFISAAGEHYVGEFRMGEKHGQGKRVFDGKEISGRFECGAFCGVGTIKTSEFVFDGDIQGHMPHGTGHWKDVNGNRSYHGTFRAGLFHGHGKLSASEEYDYVGSFENGKYHGFGTLTFSSGRKYVGQFENGLSEGQGVLNCVQTNAKYVGAFCKGKPNGSIEMSWLDKRTKVTQTVEFVDGIQLTES
jgi:hypothetical protein